MSTHNTPSQKGQDHTSMKDSEKTPTTATSTGAGRRDQPKGASHK